MKNLDAALQPSGVYRLMKRYAKHVGISVDIAKVQEWLGHVSISTTRVYVHRKSRPKDSPMFKVTY